MPNVSIFSNVYTVTNPENIDLILYLEQTRDGKWEDLVTQCRVIKDKELRDKFKQTMPTTTLSGMFNTRSDSGLEEHSGYIAIDLDTLKELEYVKRNLELDKFVYSVFFSTSGNGLRVLFKIDPLKHRESFIGICQYLFEKYELIADPNGVNPSKPYVVSWDPYLFINPNDVPVFKKYAKETVFKKLPDFLHTAGDFDSVLKQVIGRGLNICESYTDWLKIGFSLSEQFGESGREYFHSISAISKKYKSIKVDQQYTACIKAKGSTKINISTFYYLARLSGATISSEQTKTIVRTTKNGKRAGLTKKQIIDNLQKFSNISGADSVVDRVFDSPNEDFDADEGSVLEQLELFVSNNYHLRMNEVTGYFEHDRTPLLPSALNSIFIAAKKLIPKLDYQLMMRLLRSDFIPSFNPFFEFLESDGLPVILPATPVENNELFKAPLLSMLASTIENDNPAFTEYFVKKWMVGMISAMHKVHSPLLLALLGAQNTGKTEFFRRLMPKELMLYYAESKLDQGKDDELLMCENIVVMDDELGGKSKQDSKKLNDVTSKQWFSLRRPYGDHNEKVLRLAVLCGTSNYTEILADTSGNRRIIPIDVKNINKELYNKIDKKEMFREAYTLYKGGFDWRITSIDIPFLNNNSQKYEIVSKERELISKYFEPKVDSELHLTTTEILVELELITRVRLSIGVLGREMEKLGFERRSVRVSQFNTPKKWLVARINRSGLDYDLDKYKPLNREAI